MVTGKMFTVTHSLTYLQASFLHFPSRFRRHLHCDTHFQDTVSSSYFCSFFSLWSSLSHPHSVWPLLFIFTVLIPIQCESYLPCTVLFKLIFTFIITLTEHLLTFTFSVCALHLYSLLSCDSHFPSHHPSPSLCSSFSPSPPAKS